MNDPLVQVLLFGILVAVEQLNQKEMSPCEVMIFYRFNGCADLKNGCRVEVIFNESLCYPPSAASLCACNRVEYWMMGLDVIMV